MDYRSAQPMLIVLVMTLFIACETSVEPEVAEESEPEPVIECVPIPEIAIWTIQVIEDDCLISEYQWDDRKAEEKLDHEWSSLRRYLEAWVVWHNKTHGTQYAVIVRRHF